MERFDLHYCSWLEELTEAQRFCESITMRILDVAEAGNEIPNELNGQYLEAHDRLRSIAGRFPPSQTPSF